MSVFLIKIIACITMVLDHIKYAIPETNNFLTLYGGRIAFPLFAFLIAEGYLHTKNLKKYYIRLLIFALISQIPFMLFRTLVGEYLLLNIMFTLLLGLITITIYDKIKRKYIAIPLILAIIGIPTIIKVDYGWYGVITTLLMYVFRNKKGYLAFIYSILVLIHYYSVGLLRTLSINIIYYFIFNCIIPSVVIFLYNGNLGKKAKYFFYAFYPIHMIIIYLMSFIH